MKKTKLKTHWTADIFPLNEADIDALAESIKRNGQREPILTLKDGRVVDGRNRWLACERIGIAPKVEVIEGDPSDEELVELVADYNCERRDLTAGQRAAAAAEAIERLYEEEDGRPGPGKKSNRSTTCASFRAGLVNTQQALTLLRNDRPKLDRVKAGEPIASIYSEYQKDKEKAEKKAAEMAFLERLGVAEKVKSGEMSFEAAFIEAKQLQEKQEYVEKLKEEQRDKYAEAFASLLHHAEWLTIAPNAKSWAGEWDAERIGKFYRPKRDPDALARLGEELVKIAAHIKTNNK